MQVTSEYGIIEPKAGGWLTCPKCRRNKRLLRVRAGTVADELPVYCRDCKTEIVLHIEQEARALSAGAHE